MTVAFGTACQACHTRGVNKRGEPCLHCSGTGLEPPQHAATRRGAPETSKAAAKSVEMTHGQFLVLSWLKDYGPMTDELLVGIAKDILSPSGARSRRAELTRDGYVVKVGERTLESGRRGSLWAAAK